MSEKQVWNPEGLSKLLHEVGRAGKIIRQQQTMPVVI